MTVLAKAQDMFDQLRTWRREFHRRPELGFQEFATAERAALLLCEWGYRVRRGVGRSGVVAEQGQGPPCVALRADMDALPLQEANEVPYASQVPGVMHACGHDAHTAMVLGAAALLAQERLPGAVRILLQPSEEANDNEGLSGAPRMIQDGALDGVNAILALHVDPSVPVGSIRIASGIAGGGVDSFFITIRGQGGHGAAPHTTVDPIYLTAHVLMALYGLVSRRVDPFAPAVVSIGSLHGGQAENVIPSQVELAGTLRYQQAEVRQLLHDEVKRAVEIARTLGGEAELRMVPGTPPLVNDSYMAELIATVAAEHLGPQQVLPLEASLGAEDFGCFTEVVPGAMFSLGCRIEGDERHLHSPRFDIDEACLPIGAGLLAAVALRYLQEASSSAAQVGVE